MAGAHSLAPAQSSGVVGFDVGLQLGEDGEVGLHPVGMGLVPGRRTDEAKEEEETQTRLIFIYLFF